MLVVEDNQNSAVQLQTVKMSAQYSPSFSTTVFTLNNHPHQMSLPTQQYQHLQHFLDASAHALSTSALDLCVRKRRHQSPTPASPPRTDYQPPTPPTPPPPHSPPCHITLPTAIPSQIKPQTQQNANRMDVPSSTSNITFCTSSSPHSNSGSDSSESLDICGNESTDERQQHSQYQLQQVSTSKGSKVKVPRPFKAYPKDPLSLTLGVSTATATGCSAKGLLGIEGGSDAYSEFRNRMLRHVQANYSHGTNKNMRRTGHASSSIASCSSAEATNTADQKYMEMRRKNNEAAKRSRDARRAKEDEIAIRCAFLEQENLKLRYELAAVKSETERLRGILAYSS